MRDSLKRSDKEDLNDVERGRVDELVWCPDHADDFASEISQVFCRGIFHDLQSRCPVRVGLENDHPQATGLTSSYAEENREMRTLSRITAVATFQLESCRVRPQATCGVQKAYQ